MEILLFLIPIAIWGFSIHISAQSAAKIGANQVVAILAAIVAPVLAPIVYYYLASNRGKDGKVNKDELYKQLGKVVVVLIVLYFISTVISSLFAS